MRILVTGARGLLGRACLTTASGKKHELFGLDVDELDVTDREAVDHAMSEMKPEVVLHCAAYTNVDRAETEMDEAMEVNATGAKWMAEAAHRVGSTMLYVSTDYVFDGESAMPYREEDEPHPVSRYGVSKYAGEREVAQACPGRHVIVRTAWLYGDGAGFVDWVCRGLDSGETLRLVEDHRGSPTYAADLAKALLRLVVKGRRGIYHFANKGETSWLDWGRTIAELTGRPDTRFEAVAADDLGRAAPRPPYTVLAVDKYENATDCQVPTWQDALRRYLESTNRLR